MLKHFLLCTCVCPYNYTDPLSINDLYHVNVHLIEMVIFGGSLVLLLVWSHSLWRELGAIAVLKMQKVLSRKCLQLGSKEKTDFVMTAVLTGER